MNPYTNRVMIRNPEDFYDRKAEVKRIFSRIGGSRPQSISVVGDRRIGKSSLLFHICDESVREKYLEEPETYVFAFFDLQEKKDMDVKEFFRIVIEKITKQLPEKVAYSVQEFSYDSFSDFVRTIEENGMNLILVFDEFDIVTTNENFSAEFFSFLRFIANSRNVAYVTSSKRDLQELCHANEIKDSPFFNIFTHIPLGPFDKDSALELIKIPSEREGIPLERYREFILELAGYHPFFIQLACSNFFEALLECKDHSVLEKAKGKFYEEAEDHFKNMWHHLTEYEVLCLKTVVESKELDQNLLYIARKLERRGILVRIEEYYKVFSICFKEFIETVDKIDIPRENSKKKENIELTKKIQEIKDEMKKKSEISAKKYVHALKASLLILPVILLVFCIAKHNLNAFWCIIQIICGAVTIFGIVLAPFDRMWKKLEKKIACDLYSKKEKEVGLDRIKTLI